MQKQLQRSAHYLVTGKNPDAVWYKVFVVASVRSLISICCCSLEVTVPETTAVIRKNTSKIMSLLL